MDNYCYKTIVILWWCWQPRFIENCPQDVKHFSIHFIWSSHKIWGGILSQLGSHCLSGFPNGSQLINGLPKSQGQILPLTIPTSKYIKWDWGIFRYLFCQKHLAVIKALRLKHRTLGRGSQDTGPVLGFTIWNAAKSVTMNLGSPTIWIKLSYVNGKHVLTKLRQAK